jgi:hypothetical protein
LQKNIGKKAPREMLIKLTPACKMLVKLPPGCKRFIHNENKNDRTLISIFYCILMLFYRAYAYHAFYKRGKPDKNEFQRGKGWQIDFINYSNAYLRQ